MAPHSSEDPTTAQRTPGLPPANGKAKDGMEGLSRRKPWWKSAVPTFVTAGLLGSVLGLGVAWGGSQALVGAQDAKIEKVEKAVEAKEERLRAQEIDGAALKAGNEAQHEALTEKVEEVKADTAVVKQDIADVKADVADVKRDTLRLVQKMDQLLAKTR